MTGPGGLEHQFLTAGTLTRNKEAERLAANHRCFRLRQKHTLWCLRYHDSACLLPSRAARGARRPNTSHISLIHTRGKGASMRFRQPIVLLPLALAAAVAAAGTSLTAAVPARAASPAHAASPARTTRPGVACNVRSSTRLTFSPPLTTAEKNVKITVYTTYRSCVSAGALPRVSSGTEHHAVMAEASCQDPVSWGKVTGTIAWNTGQTSTYRATRVTLDALLAVVNTEHGTISRGLFKGDDFMQIQAGSAIQFIRCITKHAPISSFKEQTFLTIGKP
jgi:hypothetical protein